MEKEDLKKKIKEIVEVVKVCPANLQEKCFEVLLNAELFGNKRGPVTGESEESRVVGQGQSSVAIPPEISKRIKAFCGQYQLTSDMIAKVYAVDEQGNVSIEATDLKTKKTSQQQRRLALLIGVRHQFLDGAFDVPMEELRELCVTYGVYDAANFKANIKNASDIFSGKIASVNKLSPIGKKEGAELVKELAA